MPISGLVRTITGGWYWNSFWSPTSYGIGGRVPVCWVYRRLSFPWRSSFCGTCSRVLKTGPLSGFKWRCTELYVIIVYAQEPVYFHLTWIRFKIVLLFRRVFFLPLNWFLVAYLGELLWEFFNLLPMGFLWIYIFLCDLHRSKISWFGLYFNTSVQWSFYFVQIFGEHLVRPEHHIFVFTNQFG